MYITYAQQAARETLAGLDEARKDGLYSDDDRRDERDPAYWVGRLSQSLETLLSATEQAATAGTDAS